MLDAGINFIDTSIDYGRSEELIGKFIAHRRAEYYLASKCGCVPGAPQGSDHVHTAKNIRNGVENSLRLLKTDHLDLVQFHRSLSRRSSKPKARWKSCSSSATRARLRFVGVSGSPADLDEQIDMGVFDAFQIPYSALQRDHEDVITRASDAGAGHHHPRRCRRGAPDDWNHRRYYMVSNDAMRDRWDEAKLDELLNGMSRMEFMLRFTLSHPDLDTTIVGTKSLEHLRDNLTAAANGPLPTDLVIDAKNRLTAAASSQ